MLLTLDGGRLGDEVEKVLTVAGVEIHEEVADSETRVRYGAIVVDASGLSNSESLRALYEALHGSIRRLGVCGRIVVLGGVPSLEADAGAYAAQRALEGFVRSVAKELRAGSTANLIEVARGSETGVAAPLRFLVSSKSAFVCGQRITVGAPSDSLPEVVDDDAQPLEGKVAVVTGAARGHWSLYRGSPVARRSTRRLHRFTDGW